MLLAASTFAGCGGTAENETTADTVETVPAAVWNGDQYADYYQTFQSEDQGTANYWDDKGSVAGDLHSYFAGGFWGTAMNEEKDGYDWICELAKEKPVAQNPDESGLATIYKFEVKIGSELVYNTLSEKPEFAAFAGREVELEDYLTTWKEMYTKSNNIARGAEGLSGSGSIKGLQEFYNGTENGFDEELWNNVGVKATMEDGKAYITVEFNELTNPFYAMYYLASNLNGPIPADFLELIGGLKEHINEENIKRFNSIKRTKKEQLCNVIAKNEGVMLNPDFMFDVQVKRLHMYKRQLMNAISIADIYFRLKEGRLEGFHPTCFIFGAKAAPGYEDAKSVIRYINRLAKLINNDPAVNNKMRVCFVHNYNCSYAEHIIPAADISEQISPAGLEASGTGNMKLMLNGAVTLGTLDGANVEIAQEAGHANEYIFGATVDEINAIKGNYYAKNFYDANSDLRRALDTMVNGTVETDNGIREVYNKLINWGPSSDQYYVLKDYASYIDAKLRANAEYADRLAFGRKCLVNVASAAKFSSDRTIRQYASEIWHIEPTVR